MREKLEFVYGPEIGQHLFEQITALVGKYAYLKNRVPIMPPAQRLTERDIVLITYGDQLHSDGATPLETLHGWLQKHLQGVVNTVHILPFYPYTSDDGFSVVDYREVDPALGSWDEVMALHTDFKLMFDAVINHISASSAWFQGFLRQEQPYADFFIVTDPNADLSQVTRPRTLPLLTRFDTTDSPKYLWSTFSPDQLDLNYKNPAVLLDIADLLLFYVSQGADLIRLDAIGYLWKEIGTNCIHLPQTHAVVQILREVMDECAPNVVFITETNVPHRDNISYFGDGHNEAQMVYQFPLVPLVLNALASNNAQHLREWAATLAKPSDTTGFFNFLASHDGIGLVPAKSILSEAEVSQLVAQTLAHGGKVSYKNNPDGSQSAYELNITFFDALSNPADTIESDETKISRFLVSQAIMLAMQGVPGIYFQSLLGSHNWQAGLAQTGRNRTINRQKFALTGLEQALADPTSQTSQVFKRYLALLASRIAHPAFHPNASQTIVSLPNHPALFGLLRTATDDKEQILAIHNVANTSQTCQVSPTQIGFGAGDKFTDLVANQSYSTDTVGQLYLNIGPYQILWLCNQV